MKGEEALMREKYVKRKEEEEEEEGGERWVMNEQKLGMKEKLRRGI